MRFITRRNVWDDVFDNFLTNQDSKTDIYEDEKGVNFEIEVPGFKKEDISIDLRDHVLQIVATKKSETEDEDNDLHYYIKGRKSFEIRRSYRLKNEVTEDDIKVKLEDGLLKILVVKTEKEISAPKSIMIE